MNRLRLFNAIAVSTLIASILLVALALATVKVLDRRVIESAAARNRHAEFLLAASAVGHSIAAPEDLENAARMNALLERIQHLRPGIRALELLAFRSGTVTPVTRTGRNHPAGSLSDSEIDALRKNTILSRFDDAGEDRAWVFTAPIMSNEKVVGALRGRFSVSKYDALILGQEQVAKQVAIGAVVLTSLIMLLLIRFQLHRPLARLLGTMEHIRSGHLTRAAPVSGPLEVRRLADTFNQMMAQLHAAMLEKEALMKEIRDWNDLLQSKVTAAVEELEREKDKVAEAQALMQRNSNLAALGEMSAIMAHELGNPLNVISGRLQLMHHAVSAEQRLTHAEVIKKQVARMTDVMQHILKSTRVEGELSPVQINEVVREVLALFHVPGVKILTHLAPELPAAAANRTALHGVIVNLVTNAMQAMRDDGTLTVSTCLADARTIEGHVLVRAATQEPMVRVVVEDTGCGIPGEALHRLGEPFFTTRQGEGGTGLGLAICRRVVTSSGGQFAIASTAGHGTTMTVEFPVWKERA